MRILHVNKFLYRRGGAEAYMLELAAMQGAQGHQVEYFGMQHPDNLPMRYGQFFPSHLEFDPAPPGAQERARLAARMMWSRQARTGMAAVLQDFRPDVVHLHNIYHQLSPSVLAPARKTSTPAVMTLHDYKLACPTYQLRDSNPRSGGPKLCTACVDHGVWKAATHACKDGSRAASTLAAIEVGMHRLTGAYDAVGTFVCPSNFLRDTMVRAGVYADRMHVVDNFTTIPRQARSGTGAGLVFFGRLSREKGVDTLIAAADLVARRLAPMPVVVHIAGEGPEGEALRRQAADSAAEIVFHGRLAKQELADLLLAARASVVPSRWHENQPLSVLESMAYGVPVIATNLGGLPDLIRNQHNGLLVSPDSPSELASALELYLTNPGLSAEHGTAARAEAETRFSPEIHLSRIGALYDAAIGGSVPAPAHDRLGQA